VDGNSRGEALRLKAALPDVPMQGKGLIATEAFISFPFGPSDEKVLAIRSHFFEFLAENGDLLLAHELKHGGAYEVIVTTGGGLYRYRLHDRIEVTGFIGTTPTIRFLGKSDSASDLFGEKINALHISTIIEGLPARKSKFCMLAPDKSDGLTGYTLFVESRDTLSPDMARQLEEKLSENPHYDYCIKLGQLRPAKIFQVRNDAAAAYEARMIANQMKVGDIKLPALSTLDSWHDFFVGEYL
jgi:hypothetical protein